jgi:hypothetical protein
MAVVGVLCVTRRCSVISLRSRCPCSASITTQSRPSATAISVIVGDSSVTHIPRQVSPAASFCLSTFFRLSIASA